MGALGPDGGRVQRPAATGAAFFGGCRQRSGGLLVALALPTLVAVALPDPASPVAVAGDPSSADRTVARVAGGRRWKEGRKAARWQKGSR